MNISILEVICFSLIPVSGVILGGLAGTFKKPKPIITSGTQHFAAGVVFAAVAIDLLPTVIKNGSALTISFGFLVGVVSMMLLKWFSNFISQVGKGETSFPIGMVLTMGIDLFVDGTLIGVSFLAGKGVGITIAIALAIEILFLGLSTTATLGSRGVSRKIKIVVTIALAFIIVIGAAFGVEVLGKLPSIWTEEVLAFGIAALLYLVTEELLIEAHEVKETPWITSLFFLGFLLVLFFKA